MRRLLAVVGAAALALGFASVPDPVQAAAGDKFSCRASLVRTEGFPVPLLNQEPVVSNAPNDPCVGEDNALLDPLNPLTVGNVATVRALYTQTNNNVTPAGPGSSAEARSGAADALITLPDGTTVRASALTSSATATCNGKNPPALSGSSNVLFVQIGNDAPLVNVSDQQRIDLPGGGAVILNQQVKGNNELTQRALRVEVPGIGTVTVAESVVDFHGNPCDQGTTTTPGGGPNKPPQCSNEIDDDGMGDIDFGRDPDCSSPQDDDESGNNPPECSDGQNNDDDPYTDYPADPGCEDRNDDDETDNDNPECSDGVNNDGDLRTDYPLDTGCTSPTDDDEAAGFMTGGGGYDEIDKKTLPEDVVDPGSSLRFGEVLPCDLGQKPGPNLTVSWHDPRLVEQVKLDTLTRAFCRNDPLTNPGRPASEFDTYVGEGTGRLRMPGGVTVPVTLQLISIDRGEPGAPPVIGVDFFQIQVLSGTTVIAQGVGTLDHGNIQAHTPGSFKEKKTAS
jgi:hypothetical protein